MIKSNQIQKKIIASDQTKQNRQRGIIRKIRNNTIYIRKIYIWAKSTHNSHIC